MEKCFCGQDAHQKLSEVVLASDPLPGRHELTAYVCDDHFAMIMGKAAHNMGGFLHEPITMDQAKDRILGAKGTPHRDEYEKDLNLGELAKIVVPIAQFLILNGFTQSGPYTFSNQRCQVTLQKGYTAIENTDQGIMYNEGYSIYWMIGYMTYYGMIDQNFNPLPKN